MGKCIFNELKYENLFKIDMRSFEVGTYYIKIFNDEIIKVEKIMIQ